MKNKIILCVVILMLSGCATHKSPLQEKNKFIFVTNDEKKVFQAAYDAMLEGRKETPIGDITGPIRGFTLTRKWGLDYWTSMIRVFPATGVTASGKTVHGYYPEVSGEGSLIIRGPIMDSTIYDTALLEFGKIGKKTPLKHVSRGEYLLERDGWRLHSQPSLRDGGTIKIEGTTGTSKTTEERLEKAYELMKKGVISKSEYNKLRENILSEL